MGLLNKENRTIQWDEDVPGSFSTILITVPKTTFKAIQVKAFNSIFIGGNHQ